MPLPGDPPQHTPVPPEKIDYGPLVTVTTEPVLTPEEAAHFEEARQRTLEQKAREEVVKADPGYVDLTDKLKTMTPAQWQSYLTTNMTTLPEARTIIYRMGLALMAMARQL